MKQKLYCPHCDEFHLDNELTINIETDYVECNKTKQEIKTYKYTDSESTIRWREEHNIN